ncbi:MAG: hypothetical protein ABIB47_02785 [Candidatus Woesearchaeota archaeon]
MKKRFLTPAILILLLISICYLTIGCENQVHTSVEVNEPKEETNGLISEHTVLFGFPDEFFDSSKVPKDQILKVVDAQYIALKDMHNGIVPYDRAKISYKKEVYGSTKSDGIELGDSASPELNDGNPRWEVMAHEQGHNFFGGTSSFYGDLAFPDPFLQESLAVISAVFTYREILINRERYGVDSETIDSLNFVFENEKNFQRERYEQYLEKGSVFDINDVLTSQALDYKMIEYGEEFGWDAYRKVAKAFEEGLSGEFDFISDGVSPIEKSTYIVAVLSVSFEKNFKGEFEELGFPIDDELYNEITSRLEIYLQ